LEQSVPLQKVKKSFEREGNNTDSKKYVPDLSGPWCLFRIAPAQCRIDDHCPRDLRKLLEQIAPTVIHSWFRHDVRHPEQRKDKKDAAECDSPARAVLVH
jgi:hypothetical protein